MADFPFEVVETSGEDALATWQELKKAGRGTPVVLGDNIDKYLPALDPAQAARLPPVRDVLAEAGTISFPDDLLKFRREEFERTMAALSKINPSLVIDPEEDHHEPPLGEWAEASSESPGLSVLYNSAARQIRSKVKIALVPTDDPTTIPAYLHWGHWNACPPAAYHVAALRAWRNRYGAELVGIDGDALNMRVARKPSTREEALELAQAHYIYCNDIIDQGVGSYRALASELMAHDWWFFWWD